MQTAVQMKPAVLGWRHQAEPVSICSIEPRSKVPLWRVIAAGAFALVGAGASHGQSAHVWTHCYFPKDGLTYAVPATQARTFEECRDAVRRCGGGSNFNHTTNATTLTGGQINVCSPQAPMPSWAKPGPAKPSPPKPPKRKPPPAPTATGFWISNSCHEPIQLALHYERTDGIWVTEGWWKYAPGEAAYLADEDSNNLKSTVTTWFFYAKSASYEWAGSEVLDGPRGEADLSMIKQNTQRGDYELNLTCTSSPKRPSSRSKVTPGCVGISCGDQRDTTTVPTR